MLCLSLSTHLFPPSYLLHVCLCVVRFRLPSPNSPTRCAILSGVDYSHRFLGSVSASDVFPMLQRQIYHTVYLSYLVLPPSFIGPGPELHDGPVITVRPVWPAHTRSLPTVSIPLRSFYHPPTAGIIDVLPRVLIDMDVHAYCENIRVFYQACTCVRTPTRPHRSLCRNHNRILFARYPYSPTAEQRRAPWRATRGRPPPHDRISRRA